MADEFVLINRDPVLPFADFSLETGEYVLGRSTECDLPLMDPTISRQHARLVVTDSAIQVTDLGSRNGTFVRGTQVETGVVHRGDELRFGRVSFHVDRLSGLKPPAQFAEIETIDHFQMQGMPPLPGVRTRLTPAQLRVLACLVEGMTEKEAARALAISPHTVHNHVRDIYLHLKVRSRGELMAKFIQANRSTAIDYEIPFQSTAHPNQEANDSSSKFNGHESA
jgi:DNA-binding CsgD family transcriptional regulator